MNGATCQRWCFDSSMAEMRDCRKDEELHTDPSRSKRSRRKQLLNHNSIKESRGMHPRDNPSFVTDKLRKHEPAAEDPCIGTEKNILSNARALSSSFKLVCCKNKDLSRGTRPYNYLQKRGFVENNRSDALITMYAKCGQVHRAQALLNMHGSSSHVTWTALIAGYARKKQGQNALDCFERMHQAGVPPNAATYVYVLKACAAIGAIEKGKQIHDEISRKGFLEQYIVLGNVLVDMYAKCGALPQAQSVLENLPSRDVISWNTLISGFARNQQGHQALECFEQMRNESISPDAVTYASLLKACALIGAIDKGKQIHGEISRQGFLDHDAVLGGALVHMYAKCGALSQAQSTLQNLPFRNIVSWSALIAGYVQQGQGQKALESFEQMQQESITPDTLTYTSILKACALVGDIDKGRRIHDEILRRRLLQQSIELGAALVEMYAICGALSQAHSVLAEFSFCNVVLWTTLIVGYTQNGQGQQALECFKQMQQEGIPPDAMTYASVLKACAAIGAIDKGKQIHDEISRQGLLEHDVVLDAALVDMYAKCGALSQARSVLEKLHSCDVVAWNALIVGYTQEGQDEQALHCFEQMQHENILPNTVTFLCLLNLCNHLGLVEKGQELFDSMGAMYGLRPNLECFICMIDLLGRAGHLAKALKVIQEMPFSANSAVWFCVLSACQKWVDVNVGVWVFEQAVEIDKYNVTAYILMVNIYAAAGMPEKAKGIEAMRRENKAWKQPGGSIWTI